MSGLLHDERRMRKTHDCFWLMLWHMPSCSMPSSSPARRTTAYARAWTSRSGASIRTDKCPPAPLEFAFLLDDALRERGLRERTEIVYLSPINRVFTIESVAQFVTPLLEERGIRYELFFNTESIDPHARTIISLEGTTLNYDLLVLVPPHRGAQIVVDSGLGDAQGWIPTERETLQSKADPHIYVIGDASDLPVSKSGSAAHFEAKVVAHRIVGEILGRPDDMRYDGAVMCFLETGRDQATQLVFDYTHPPAPPRPNQFYHYEKALFNNAYWYLVPRGLV
jgi:sulfide:quinone oxidoreductase